jgi:plastocyanin
MKKHLAIAATGLLLASACSDSSDSKADLTVRVSEWIFEPSAKTVKSGDVTIAVNNVGTKEHELVVIKGSDPAAFEADKRGEVEGVLAASDKSATLALEPGNYVIFCNLVDADGTSHFAKGMVSTLTVD